MSTPNPTDEHLKSCHLCDRRSYTSGPNGTLVCDACGEAYAPTAGWDGRHFRKVRQRDMLDYHGLTPVETGANCVRRVVGKRCQGSDCSCHRGGAAGRSVFDHVQLWRDQDRALVWTSEPYHVDEATLDEVMRELGPLGIEVEVGGYSPHAPGSTTLLKFRAR